MGASILQRLDLGHLTAADPTAYVANAVDLAGDISRLADLRAGLRQRLAASPICDGHRFARTFTETLVTIARRYRA